jgi:hypothetical protein
MDVYLYRDMYIDTYMYTYFKYVYTYVYIYIYTCIYAYINTYMYTCMYIHIYMYSHLGTVTSEYYAVFVGHEGHLLHQVPGGVYRRIKVTYKGVRVRGLGVKG